MEKTKLILTQLIFINEDEEKTFLEFEERVLPLLAKYNGELLYRVRPDKQNYIGTPAECPYEIHIIAFESEADFSNYMASEERKAYMHLKDRSVKRSVLIKGESN